MRATNPQRYVCRPNFGLIQVGDAQEIQVLLSYEELDGKVKGDKFEVQWAEIVGEDTGGMAKAKELLVASGNRVIVKVKYVPGERLQMNLSSQFSFSESTPPPQQKNPLVTEWKPSPSPILNPITKSPRNKAKVNADSRSEPVDNLRKGSGDDGATPSKRNNEQITNEANAKSSSATVVLKKSRSCVPSISISIIVALIAVILYLFLK